jgi:hypothetical protein
MIEQRQLTESEFNRLVQEAPESETQFLRTLSPAGYLWMKTYATEMDGILVDGKPIYFGAVVINRIGRPTLWTVVNSNVKEQFSLFKISKKGILKWLNKYKVIFATMHKDCQKNLEWTKRLGFIPIEETMDTVTLRIGG